MSGVRHWWLQRITAVILIPLTLWFVFAIVARIDGDFIAVREWIAEPVIAAALVVYLAALFFHAQLGLQVVIEDYVVAARRGKVILACQLINIAAFAVAVFAVVQISFN